MRVDPSLEHHLAVLAAAGWVRGFAGWGERKLERRRHDRTFLEAEVAGVHWRGIGFVP